MQITVCAKCLETKCACEFYRQRFPVEWAERDKTGCAPISELGKPSGFSDDRTAGKHTTVSLVNQTCQPS